MEKITKILKQKVKDEVATCAILIAICITFAVNIGINEYVKNTKLTVANTNISQIKEEEITQNIESRKISQIEENSNQILDSVVDEKEAKKKNEEEYEKLKKEKKITATSPTYYIKVNYKAQVVTIYKKDSNGKYTKPVKAMICSTGTYTPNSGTYRTLAKRNWWPLYGDVYGQYATHIVDGILFHSVPYLKSGDRSSLEYWAYDQLGSRVSMGCVRLTVADAKWIYQNCTIGTQVEFYSSSNPGPLGKPSARKISNAPKNVRGWDPTDPNKKNPWPAYLKNLEKKEKEKDKQKDKEKNNNKNNTTKPTITTEKPKEDNKPEVNETVNSIVEKNEVTEDINSNQVDEELVSNGIGI